jgi:hypothetical protein
MRMRRLRRDVGGSARRTPSTNGEAAFAYLDYDDPGHNLDNDIGNDYDDYGGG